MAITGFSKFWIYSIRSTGGPSPGPPAEASVISQPAEKQYFISFFPSFSLILGAPVITTALMLSSFRMSSSALYRSHLKAVFMVFNRFGRLKVILATFSIFSISRVSKLKVYPSFSLLCLVALHCLVGIKRFSKRL